MPLNVNDFAGANLGQKLHAALLTVGAGGSVIDCRDATGAQSIAEDVFAGIASAPLVLLFGPSQITVTANQMIPSRVTIRMDHTEFHGSGAVTYIFVGKTTLGTALTAKGSPAVIPTSAVLSRCQVGDGMVVFGHIPEGGTDESVLVGGVSSTDTLLTLASTNGLASVDFDSKVLRVDDELISYSSVSVDPPTVSVLSRGFGGTTPASHTSGARVVRAVDQYFTIKSIQGSVLLLDANVQIGGGTIPIVLGTTDVAIEGCGRFTGKNLTQAAVIRHWRIGEDVKVSGVGSLYIASRDSRIDGYYENSPGASVFMIANIDRNMVSATVVGAKDGIKIDDRSDLGDRYNNESAFNLIEPDIADGVHSAVLLEGTNKSLVRCGLARRLPVRGIVVNFVSAQWTNVPTLRENAVFGGQSILEEERSYLGISGYLENGRNYFLVRSSGHVGGRPFTWDKGVPGNYFCVPGGVQVVSPAGTVETNAFAGDYFSITVTTGTGVVFFDAPDNSSYGRRITYAIANETAGNISSTWNDVFAIRAPLSVPSGGTRSITFYYDGVAWNETARTG